MGLSNAIHLRASDTSGTSSSSNPATRTASRTPSRSRSRLWKSVRTRPTRTCRRWVSRTRTYVARARTASISFPDARAAPYYLRATVVVDGEATRATHDFLVTAAGNANAYASAVLDARMRDVDVSRPLVGFLRERRRAIDARDSRRFRRRRRRALGVVRARLDDSRRREPESRTHQSRTNRTHVQRHRRGGIRHLHRSGRRGRTNPRGKLARNRRRVASVVRVAVAPSRDAPVADDARVLETPNTVRAGRPAVLRLTSRDAFGNDAAYWRRAARRRSRRATLDSDGANRSLELVARLGDNNDGTYDLTFRPTVVGTYALSATLGGADVPALAGATMTVTHAEAYSAGVDDGRRTLRRRRPASRAPSKSSRAISLETRITRATRRSR